MKDIIFKGYVATISVAMLAAVYGTVIKNMPVIIASVLLGLIATGVGWLAFIRDLRAHSDTFSQRLTQ